MPDKENLETQNRRILDAVLENENVRLIIL